MNLRMSKISDQQDSIQSLPHEFDGELAINTREQQLQPILEVTIKCGISVLHRSEPPQADH